ncbi:MAG: leucyl aminopeptidase family protein [Microscillaceae bacterium]|jgi:leucyl aminopeptidase|nr:leucyl aminopeptidase family protein [Microscillaceae bacterium]
MNFVIKNALNPAIDNLLIPIEAGNNLIEVLEDWKKQLGLVGQQFSQDFKADLKEIQVGYTPTQKVYFLGLGKKPSSSNLIRAFRYFFHQHKNKISGSLGIDCGDIWGDLQYVVNGVLLGKYDVQLYKTDKNVTKNFFFNESSIELYIGEGSTQIADNQVFIGKSTAETQMQVMDLVNAPANHKNPQTLANWAKDSGEKYGYSVKILDTTDLKQQGLEALLAVSQGSVNPPCLIVMEYMPTNIEVQTKVGLVGKGVTFDTGGVSIKGSTNMHYMKSDMGGAAAVLGAMELTAKLQLPVHLIGVVPSTENFIDSQSLKPGDVIGSYLGKTIEVIDTDAEGRLILADGLAYLNRNFQPDILLDLATLTGSCVQTLGYAAGGLFTNNDELADNLLKISALSGEKLWRLPLWDDYKDDISSDVADLRNYSGKPIAGAISAAKFLEVFTENHPAFAHLDIAGVAFGDSEFAGMKSATAYGVRLLVEWLQKL